MTSRENVRTADPKAPWIIGASAVLAGCLVAGSLYIALVDRQSAGGSPETQEEADEIAHHNELPYPPVVGLSMREGTEVLNANGYRVVKRGFGMIVVQHAPNERSVIKLIGAQRTRAGGP